MTEQELRALAAFVVTFAVLRAITAIIHFQLFPHGPFRDLVTFLKPAGENPGGFRWEHNALLSASSYGDAVALRISWVNPSLSVLDRRGMASGAPVGSGTHPGSRSMATPSSQVRLAA